MSRAIIRQDCEDIFMDSFIILNKKYIEEGRFKIRENEPRYEGLKRVLFGIVRLEVKRRQIAKIDENFYKNGGEEDEHPPSYYLKKKWMADWKEKNKDHIREYNLKNRDKEKIRRDRWLAKPGNKEKIYKATKEWKKKRDILLNSNPIEKEKYREKTRALQKKNRKKRMQNPEYRKMINRQVKEWRLKKKINENNKERIPHSVQLGGNGRTLLAV